MWLLPSRQRLNSLKRFFVACREMGVDTPGYLLVNEKELEDLRAEYSALMLPKNWEIRAVPGDCLGDAVRAAWSWPEVNGAEWVGLICDDQVPASPNWDTLLVKSLSGWNMVSSNDGWQAPQRIHGAIVWSGDLLRTVGYIFPPGFRHLFQDDVWETLGKETGCWQLRMDVMVRHLHALNGGISDQTTEHVNSSWANDEELYKEWLMAERPASVKRIQALMQSKGVAMLKPEMSGVRLMVGTPSIDGTYQSSFVVGLFNSFQAMQQNNVRIEWAEEKYNADIALARAKLLGSFRRSSCTHLLMIDADMGWEPQAILRLFCTGKDVVAVAGPKKRYPITFAANHTDKNGNPIPLEFDNRSGTVEVSQVGLAFALISRACVEQMVAAYPELEFRGATGEIDHALFNPIVKDGRYFAEDFAFCERWRAIGGSVHVCPDVPLKHVGNHTFEGALAQTAQAQAQEKAA